MPPSINSSQILKHFWVYLGFAREEVKTVLVIVSVSEGNIMLRGRERVACELRVEQASLRHTCHSSHWNGRQALSSRLAVL